MHDSAYRFAITAISEADIAGKRVVEVGSYNVNGSARAAYAEAESYIGVDMLPGPGVDVVCPAEKMPEVLDAESADIVISTEMLEHAEDWRAAIFAMVFILAPTGHLLLTTRSTGFPYHPHPNDYWRFSVTTMRAILAAVGLKVLRVEPDDPATPGVFALARKPTSWTQLGGHELDAIEAAPAVRRDGFGTFEGDSMRQARDSGWYATDSGAEVFIAKGTVRPDNHPDVQAIPSLFDALAEEQPPAKRPAKDTK